MEADEKLLVICLPGMDGTGALFEAFCAGSPAWAACNVVRYPVDRALGYEWLAGDAEGVIRLTQKILGFLEMDGGNRRILVVAESFSGAVGVRICEEWKEKVAGLVLVNSFLTPPGWGLMKGVPWGLIFAAPTVKWGVKQVLMQGRSETGIRAVCKAIGQVKGDVMAERARMIARVDERERFARLEVPVLALRGLSDRLVSRAKVMEMKTLNKRVTVKEIEGPHLLLQARPKEAWGAIEEWWRGMA
jgi:pimeloyl-[acyl-carrier protein] methyl ester esterase